MNIVNKLTLRHMKINKKRTVVTTIAIIIAVAMITAVSILSYAILDYFGRVEMKSSANMQLKIEGFKYENLDRIIDELKVDKSYIAKVYGDYTLNYNEKDLGLIQLTAVCDDYYDMMNIELLAGRLPENGDEIVLSGMISYPFIEDGIGKRVVIGDNEYIVVGISKTIDFDSVNIESNEGVIYPIWTKMDIDSLKKDDKVNGYFYSNIVDSDYMDKAEGLMDELDNGAKLVPNNVVLTYYGQSQYDNVKGMMDKFKAALIVIIIIGAVALISNAFAISVSERSRYLGMLASVGATKKQKRMSIYFEGFIEGIIGIVLGIISGYAGIKITFMFVQPLFDRLLGENVEINIIVNSDVIVATIIIAAITIGLSTYFPARRASKITAIDAIRQSKDIKISEKTVKTSYLTRKIFGFEGELALKNLKRNKKRYRVTIFSLFISLTLFLVVFAYVSLIKQQFIAVNGMSADHDITFNVYRESDGIKIYNELKNSDNLSGRTYYEYFCYDFSKEEYVDNLSYVDLEPLKEYFTKDCKECIERSFEDYEFNLSLITLEEGDLKELLNKSGYNYNDFVSKDNNVIILNQLDCKFYKEDDALMYKNKFLDKECEGKEFELEFGYYRDYLEPNEWRDESSESANEITKKTTIRPYMVTTDIPTGLRREGMYITMIVTPNFVKNNKMSGGDMVVFQTKNNKKFVKELESIIEKYGLSEDEYSLYNFVEEQEQMNNLLLIISVFVYGFIILMTLICVANIFNTISTSIALRKREFAMLKSVGMTPKSFRKMIAYESAFYGIKALLFGLPLSTAVIVWMQIGITESMYNHISFPWLGYVIAVAGVFFVIGLTMLYSSGKVRKENVIDCLKDENING